MGGYSGDSVQVGVSKEAVRGTAGAPTYGLLWSDLQVTDKVMTAVEQAHGGRIEDSAGEAVVGTFAEGSLSGAIRSSNIGLLLLGLLGTDTPSTVETGVYDHVFSVAQSANHQSLTFHRKDANGGIDYALGMVEALEFAVDIQNFANFTAKFRSKAGVAGSQTVSYATEYTFAPLMAAFKLATNQAGLTAAPAITIRSAKISIKNKLADVRSIAALAPTDIVNGGLEITGEFEMDRTAETYITALLAGTGYAARLSFTNTGVTIGVALNPTLTLDLHQLILSGSDPKDKLGDISSLKVSFKATYKVAEAKMLTFTLRNTVATY